MFIDFSTPVISPSVITFPAEVVSEGIPTPPSELIETLTLDGNFDTTESISADINTLEQ